MRFLQQFLKYNKICIQCHNNPDADTIASAYGLYCFLSEKNIVVDIIYSGPLKIKKFNVNYMIEQCKIPIYYSDTLPDCELLLIVDGQYEAGNVTTFSASNIAVIDHHLKIMDENEYTLIKSNYQSCSTIVWELLKEEGYDIKQNENLCIALLYGLFTDTASFYDLYHKKDLEMRVDLSGEYLLFDKLIKSNMTVAELMIASDAMQEHYFNPEKRFAIVSAIRCDQAILGTIGDFMIQVDVILLNFCYTKVNNGYQISVRSCDERIPANHLASYVCDGIGSGGGHTKKAGGFISINHFENKYGATDIFDYINQKLTSFINL